MNKVKWITNKRQLKWQIKCPIISYHILNCKPIWSRGLTTSLWRKIKQPSIASRNKSIPTKSRANFQSLKWIYRQTILKPEAKIKQLPTEPKKLWNCKAKEKKRQKIASGVWKYNYAKRNDNIFVIMNPYWEISKSLTFRN